jgi:hypothetical protein
MEAKAEDGPLVDPLEDSVPADPTEGEIKLAPYQSEFPLYYRDGELRVYIPAADRSYRGAVLRDMAMYSYCVKQRPAKLATIIPTVRTEGSPPSEQIFFYPDRVRSPNWGIKSRGARNRKKWNPHRDLGRRIKDEQHFALHDSSCDWCGDLYGDCDCNLPRCRRCNEPLMYCACFSGSDYGCAICGDEYCTYDHEEYDEYDAWAFEW